MKLVNTFLSLPLKRQLYIGVSAIALFSIVLTGCIVGLFYWNSFKIQVYETQNMRIRSTSQDVSNWIDGILDNLRFYSSLFNNTNMTEDEQVSMAKTLLKNNGAIHSIAMYKTRDNKVFELSQYQNTSDSLAIDPEAFNLANDRREEFISKVYDLNGQPMLTVTLPIINANNNTDGVIMAIINLRNLQHLFAVIPHDKYGYSYIMDESSRIIANNFDDELIKKQVKPPFDYFYVMTHTMFKTYQGIDGNLVIGSKSAIPTTQWYMLIEYPVLFILSKIWINLLLMFIAFLGSLVTGLLGAYLIYKNISEPLDDLTSAAHVISRGCFDVTINAQTQPEFGKVAAAFNLMNNRLKGVFKDLEYRLRSEKLLSDVAYSFINFDANSHNDYIIPYLRKIAKEIKSDCICVFYVGQERGTFINRVSWSSCDEPAINPRHDKVVLDDNPWLMYQFINHKRFILNESMQNDPVRKHIDAADEILEWENSLVRDTNEYKNLLMPNIKSQICLPFYDIRRVLGFIQLGFAEEKQLTEQDFSFLSTLSNIIGTGIQKARMSKLLAEEKERLAITLHSIAEAVVSTDTAGIVQIMNSAAEHLTGWSISDAMGKPLSDVLKFVKSNKLNETIDPVGNVISKQRISNYKSNLTLIDKSGKNIEIELSAAPVKAEGEGIVGAVLVFRDITNDLKTEREYINIQKLEAISYLSAGLAHDFNNLLFVISGSITLALDDIPADSKTADLLTKAQESTQKGNEITNQLLTFARQGVLVTGTTDIINRLDHVLELFVSKSRASIEYEIEPNLPLINMADGIVHQIITNIIINAMQSIKDKYGKLMINAKLKNVTEADCLPMETGEYISMHIIDNGEGILPENLSKLFIPYYTTKPTGTGLGLPTVYSLLTRYNGYIRISSEFGKGTDVELFFPIVKPDA